MFKNFYKSLIDYKIFKVDFFDYLTIAEKYNKIHEKVMVDYLTPDEPYFVVLEKDKSYIAFYKNIFLTFTMDKELRNRVVRIFIKNPEEDWVFNDSEMPQNTLALIYMNYDVDVLGVDRSSGRIFNSGAWNKEFYYALHEFNDKVLRFTELNQMEAAYSKRS